MVIPWSHVHRLRHEDCLACRSHRPGFLYMSVKLYFCVRFDHHGVSMGLYIGHSGSKKKFVDSLVGQLRSVYLERLLTSLDSISCFTFYQHQLVSTYIYFDMSLFIISILYRWAHGLLNVMWLSELTHIRTRMSRLRLPANR